MPEWQQGGYDGVFYLGKQGTEEYGGYVVKVDSEPNPEKWFAYEYDTEKRTTVWVGWAPTREAAQTAVKGEFLCEVWRNKETGHCPFPGAVVRSKDYRGELLRMVLCGEHSGVMDGWETHRIEEFRARFGLLPNVAVYGERAVPPLDHPTIREAVLKAGTIMERNMWIALNRVVRSLAEFRYWWGHFAKYPIEQNMVEWRSRRLAWQQAQEQAQGMYEVYMREDHGQENATLPNDLLRLIEREAVEYLKNKKGGK
ncbi:hypothetical protein [Streptomyces sp. NPDC002324]